MNILSRPQRFLWVLGILLLVGTAVGAGWFFNHPDKDAALVAEQKADSIVCIGYVDLEQGVTNLHPLQPGRVVAVHVQENDPVKKGALLLSMENTIATEDLNRAQADLGAARLSVQKAEAGVKIHKLMQEEMAEAIKGLEAGVAGQKSELATKEKLYHTPNPLISKEEFQIFEEKVKGEAAKVAMQKLKLQQLQAADPLLEVNRAREDVKAKEARVKLARFALKECDIHAPEDGMILRVLTHKDELLSAQPKLPALQFCSNAKRIIRAEVMQEWASKVEAKQVAVVEDETRAGHQWKGEVTRVSDWYTHRRSMLQEPFQYNDVRTLECLVTVEPGNRPLRIGQRVRVTIKQGGP